MNAPTCSRTTVLAVMTCILVLILAAVVPPRAAAGLLPAAQGDGVSIRFEGYLKAIGPGKMVIDVSTVLIDAQTLIIEKFGRAEVGAWVVVWGLESRTGAIYAKIIQVERPAGDSSLTWQFSGEVTKLSDPWWKINGIMVQTTGNTQIIGSPGLGWLVWVVAEYQGTAIQAIVIEAIADSPWSVPVEFEGTLEAYGPDGGQIDGHAFVMAEQSMIFGVPAAGLQAEVQAIQDTAGLLVVNLMRVIETDLPWTLRPGRNTGADAVRANGAGPSSAAAPVDALEPGATTVPWSTPDLVAGGLTDAARPALASTGDGATHAVWESGGNVLWATRAPGQGWGPARRIASGSEPTLAIDSTGILHALFTKQFMGNYEIYHVTYTAGTWTLPVNVAHTSGVSQQPALAASNDGRLYATWMDHTPGYWTVYTARWISYGFWSNQPLPYGRGQTPAIAVAEDGTLFVAWQDFVPTADNPTGYSNIFLSERQADSWSLPINLSDRDDVDAEQVSITTTADGLAHLVWIEDTRDIRYDYGQDRSWPLPSTITTASVMAHGPSIATGNGSLLHVAWDEAAVLRTTSAPGRSTIWPAPQVVATLQGTLKDVELNVTRGNEITLSWVQISGTGAASVYESRCEPLLPHRLWLPGIKSGH